MPDEDDDLRRAFAGLRRRDTEATPPFEAMIAAAEEPRGRRDAALLVGGLLAAASVVVLMVVGVAPRRPTPASPHFPRMEAWTAPTDFLLRTPGREMLDTVPRVGVIARGPGIPR